MLNGIDVSGLTIEQLVELYEQFENQNWTIDIFQRVEIELKRRGCL